MSLLLLHLAVLDEVLVPHNGPFYSAEGSPEGAQPGIHPLAQGWVSGQLPGHSRSINLFTQRGLPLVTPVQRGGGIVTLGVKLQSVFSEDLGNHILELQPPCCSGA